MRRIVPLLMVIVGIVVWRWIAVTTPDSGDEWIGILFYAAFGFSLVVDYYLNRQCRLGRFLATIELGLRVTVAASAIAATLTLLPPPGYRPAPVIVVCAVRIAVVFILDALWRADAIQKTGAVATASLRLIFGVVVTRAVQLLVLAMVAGIAVIVIGFLTPIVSGGAASAPTAAIYQIIAVPPLFLLANFAFYKRLYPWLIRRVIATPIMLPRFAGSVGLLCILLVYAVTLRPLSAPITVLDVDPSQADRIIPANFLGLSFEAPTLAGSAFDVQNTTLLNLMKTLGSGTLRFGGNEVEFTDWSPDNPATIATAYATLQPADLSRMFAFARSAGWQVILGLNLGQNEPLRFADEAETAFRLGGSSLIAVEIGNEPDLFLLNQQRTLPWNYQDYRDEAAAYIQAIKTRTPNLPIAGPAIYGDSTWFERSIQDMGSTLQLATYHFYPLTRLPIMLWGIPSAPTVDNLLSPVAIRRAVEQTDRLMQAAGSLPLQLDETNSVADSGKAGVSDVFAASLWSADHLFTLAEHGVHGVNFHTVWRCYTYTAICLRSSAYTAEPLYYGLLLFHVATQGQARRIPLTLTTTANLNAHAVMSGDNKLRIVLINKELTRRVGVSINIHSTVSNAVLTWLTAPSAYDHFHITFGGTQGVFQLDTVGEWGA